MESYLGWKIDYANPKGEAALQHPASVQWQVFKNPVALAVGGIAAVLMEFADPRIRSGVWDHSTYKADPVGRSMRTGVAAMVGCFGPASAARRVIQGVTNMHARVAGATPKGEAYRALDSELVDWVAATAGYGFLTAYHRFVASIAPEEQSRFFREGAQVARLYGAVETPDSVDGFVRMMEARLPRFEAHPIVDEFLQIIQSGRAAPNVPAFLHRALARGAVSILPAPLREKLALGPTYDLGSVEWLALKAAGTLAEVRHDASSPAAQASLRLGLPGDFLYRSSKARARLLVEAGLDGKTAQDAQHAVRADA